MNRKIRTLKQALALSGSFLILFGISSAAPAQTTGVFLSNRTHQQIGPTHTMSARPNGGGFANRGGGSADFASSGSVALDPLLGAPPDYLLSAVPGATTPPFDPLLGAPTDDLDPNASVGTPTLGLQNKRSRLNDGYPLTPTETLLVLDNTGLETTNSQQLNVATQRKPIHARDTGRMQESDLRELAQSKRTAILRSNATNNTDDGNSARRVYASPW